MDGKTSEKILSIGTTKFAYRQSGKLNFTLFVRTKLHCNATSLLLLAKTSPTCCTYKYRLKIEFVNRFEMVLYPSEAVFPVKTILYNFILRIISIIDITNIKAIITIIG